MQYSLCKHIAFLSSLCVFKYSAKSVIANDKHLIFKYYTPKQFESVKDKIIGDFYYRWDDGWTACVSSKVIPTVDKSKSTIILPDGCSLIIQ